MPAGVQGGVWVIGMIRGTAAERAGVEQGDQLLAVDGRPLDGATPFQAANLLMGAVDDGAEAPPPSAVTVTVQTPLAVPGSGWTTPRCAVGMVEDRGPPGGCECGGALVHNMCHRVEVSSRLSLCHSRV